MTTVAERTRRGRRISRDGEPEPLDLSVVVPVGEGTTLEETLVALRDSDLPRERFEIIAVLDGSPADVRPVAERHADLVVELRRVPLGPAYARNRGAEVARAERLAFVDADVRVHPDALRLMLETLEVNPDVAAVFGTYDEAPACPKLVSRYRNLLHHFTHVRDAGDAETFWAGLGAVRRSVFRQLGGFDEWHFRRPEIEDIELGRRIRLSGHRILLRADIRGRHLKRWTLRAMLSTDLRRRGIVWTRLLLSEGPGAAWTKLNVRPSERWCTALVGTAVLLAGAAAIFRAPLLLVGSGAALATLIFLNREFYGLLWRRGGTGLLLAGIPLHLLYHLLNGIAAVVGLGIHTLVGPPVPSAETWGLHELGIERSPPVPSPPRESTWYGRAHRPEG